VPTSPLSSPPPDLFTSPPSSPASVFSNKDVDADCSWKTLGEFDEQDEEQEGENGYEDQDIEMGEHEAKNGHSEPRSPRSTTSNKRFKKT
jgi:hypothetical protein